MCPAVLALWFTVYFSDFSFYGRRPWGLRWFKVSTLVVLPLWASSVGSSRAHHLATVLSRLPSLSCPSLPLFPAVGRQVGARLWMTVMLRSGDPLRAEICHRKSPVSLLHHGGSVPGASTGVILINGCDSVIFGRCPRSSLMWVSSWSSSCPFSAGVRRTVLVWVTVPWAPLGLPYHPSPPSTVVQRASIRLWGDS